MMRNGIRRGFVLLVALGVLSLMSVLAIAFVVYARIDRNVSRNYLDRVRAMMVVESGIDNAIQSINGLDLEQLKAACDSELAFSQAVNVKYNDAIGNFASGVVGSTYVTDGDCYYLKIRDTSGRVNLNDTLDFQNLDTEINADFGASDPDANALTLSDDANFPNVRLYGIVKQLAISGCGVDEATAETVADAIIAARRDGTISSYAQLKQILVGAQQYPLNETQFTNGFLPHVCLGSWQDPTVITPTFTVAVTNSGAYGTADIDFWMASGGVPVYRWEDFQTRTFARQSGPRSPVNINTASVPVIESMLANLEAWYLFEAPGITGPNNGAPADSISSSFNSTYFHNGQTGRCGTPPFNGDANGNGIPDSEENPDETLETVPGNNGTTYNGGASLQFNENSPAPRMGMYANNMVEEEVQYNDGGGLQGGLGNPNGGLGVPVGDDDDDTTDPQNPPAPKFDHSDAGIMGFDNTYGYLRKTLPLSADAVRNIAQAIHERAKAKPFRSWQEFELWLRGAGMPTAGGEPVSCNLDDFCAPYVQSLEEQGIPVGGWEKHYYARLTQDLIVAAFNPNTRLNDFNPDKSDFRLIDKAQLTRHTTEACLEPTGVFEIECEGRIYSSPTEVVASRQINATIRAFDTVRVTSQSQFFDGVGATKALTEYIGKAGADGVTPMDRSLTAYPEPVIGSGGAVDAQTYTNFRLASADGSLRLAPMQSPKSFVGMAKFINDFDGGLKAMVAAGGNDAPYNKTDVPSFDAGRNNCYAGRLLADFTGTSANQEHAVLYPDGAFSEAGKTLAYHNACVKENEGKQAIISFWAKPCYTMESAPRPRKLLSLWQGTMGDVLNTTPSTMGLWYFPHYQDIELSGSQDEIAATLNELGMPKVWLSGHDIWNTIDFAGEPDIQMWPYSMVCGLRREVPGGATLFGASGLTRTGFAAYDARAAGNARALFHVPTAQLDAENSPWLGGRAWNHIVMAYDYRGQIDTTVTTTTTYTNGDTTGLQNGDLQNTQNANGAGGATMRMYIDQTQVNANGNANGSIGNPSGPTVVSQSSTTTSQSQAKPYYFFAMYNGVSTLGPNADGQFGDIFPSQAEYAGAGDGANTFSLTGTDGGQGLPTVLPMLPEDEMNRQFYNTYIRFGELNTPYNRLMADMTVANVVIMTESWTGPQPGDDDGDGDNNNNGGGREGTQFEQGNQFGAPANTGLRHSAADASFGYYREEARREQEVPEREVPPAGQTWTETSSTTTTTPPGQPVEEVHAKCTDLFVKEVYQKGRYAHLVDANGFVGEYTSPAIDLGRWLKADKSYQLRSVSYTYYRPLNNRPYPANEIQFENDVNDQIADPLDSYEYTDEHRAVHEAFGGMAVKLPALDPVCINIADPKTGDWVYSDKKDMVMECRAHRLNQTGAPAAGLAFNSQLPLQFKVSFNAITNGPLYESFTFEDITFTVTSSKPEILLWSVED